MSTSMNHQKRSHRSTYAHRSAVGNMARRHYIKKATDNSNRFNLRRLLKHMRRNQEAEA